MTDYTLIGTEDMTTTADRQSPVIRFRTDKGLVSFALPAQKLDSFITHLQVLEQQLSLLDPSKGARPGEPVPLRAQIVDGFQMGPGTGPDGQPAMMLALHSNKVERWHAIPAGLALQIQKGFESEIPKLGKVAKPS